jgi:hypothetical protein
MCNLRRPADALARLGVRVDGFAEIDFAEEQFYF